MSKLMELQERRNELAAEIYEVGGMLKEDGTWPSDAVERRWESANAKFDAVCGEMKSASHSDNVLGRVDQVKNLQNSPTDPERAKRIIQSQHPGQPRVGAIERSDRPQFMDANTGKALPVMMPGDKAANLYGHSEGLPRLGAVVASKLMGRPIGISEDQYMASISGIDGQGNHAIQPSLFPQFLDLVREKMVTVSAGAMQFTMPTREVTVVKLDSDMTAEFRHEGNKSAYTEAGFGTYSLRAKSLAALTSFTIELDMFAPNLVDFIEQVMTEAMAQAMDRACMYGTGEGPEPLGVINTPGINEVASVGTPTDYSEVTEGVGKILDKNYDEEQAGSLAWIRHPRDARTYQGLTDTTGQPLMPTPWAQALRKMSTTGLPTTDGAGNNESTSVIGDFSNLLIGSVNGLRFERFNVGTTDKGNALEEGLIHVRMMAFMDCCVLRPGFFTKMTGITAS
ncbi:MAG: phage major capsid protein [Planctomycetota bacterium]